jgi:hypothetical protein
MDTEIGIVYSNHGLTQMNTDLNYFHTNWRQTTKTTDAAYLLPSTGENIAVADQTAETVRKIILSLRFSGERKEEGGEIVLCF